MHRLTHQARSSVYAHTAEIDAWLKTRSGRAAAGKVDSSQANGSSARSGRPLAAWLWPMAIGLAAACILVGGWAWYRSLRIVAGPATLAVLPFDSLAGSDDPFASGLTEDVISDLGESGHFTVVSDRISRGYRNQQLSLAEVAGHLHATRLLRGTVAQVADQVSVTIELVDAVQEKHLWGKTYSFKTADAPRSEDDLAATIAEAVSEQMGSPLKPRSAPRSSDPRAMQAYLAGRFFWNQRDLPDLQKSIASYRQAIGIDPKFAGAYAGLADVYDLMTDRGVMPDEEAFRLAKQNAHAALDLDPNSAEAYNALAFTSYRQDWDFTDAEAYFRKAIALNPNDAVAHQWYGEFLGDLRRFDESIAELRRASQLKPLSPMVGCDLADGYLHAGRLAEAEAELKRILDMYPNFIPAHMYLVAVYISMPNLAKAEAEAQTYGSMAGDPDSVRAVRVRRLVAKGKIDEARALARDIMARKQGHVLGAYWRAQLYFVTGQKDAGYAALEESFREHSWWLATMLVDPGFVMVRNEPRFLNMAHRVGLPGTEPQLQARAGFRN